MEERIKALEEYTKALEEYTKALGTRIAVLARTVLPVLPGRAFALDDMPSHDHRSLPVHESFYPFPDDDRRFQQ